MNTAIIVLIIVTVVFTISIISFLICAIKSKSYLAYREKLKAFEEKKARIEAELENDRKDFKHGS
jgi:biopolymer transport protein ExbB/TolQ